MGKRVVIALGGNAILTSTDKGTIAEQIDRLTNSCAHLVKIVEAGHTVVITHGNGPQVGDILLRAELAKHQLPPPPLDVCGAETQGMLGYLIQQVIQNQLKKKGIERHVISVVTQVLVDKDDPAFKNPTKPVGEYFSREEAARLEKERGWRLAEERGKGWRRVVPSPRPIKIIEEEAIRDLVEHNLIVIACGGGGIPVVYNQNGELVGVEGVIDKDLTAEVLARTISADILLILTDTDKVCLNFGTAHEVRLDQINVADAKKYLSKGEFPKGSMGPKIEAAIKFVEGGGEKAIIAHLEKGLDALEGRAGTVIKL